MRYILPSRDLITASVECMVRAHRFDGMVLLGSCDKIVPGLLMAAARLDIPAIFLNGGPMMPAVYKGESYDGNIVTEAVGWKSRGEIGEAEFREIETWRTVRGVLRHAGDGQHHGMYGGGYGHEPAGHGSDPGGLTPSGCRGVLHRRSGDGSDPGRNHCETDYQGAKSIENAITVLMGDGRLHQRHHASAGNL